MQFRFLRRMVLVLVLLSSFCKGAGLPCSTVIREPIAPPPKDTTLLWTVRMRKGPLDSWQTVQVIRDGQSSRLLSVEPALHLVRDPSRVAVYPADFRHFWIGSQGLAGPVFQQQARSLATVSAYLSLQTVPPWLFSWVSKDLWCPTQHSYVDLVSAEERLTSWVRVTERSAGQGGFPTHPTWKDRLPFEHLLDLLGLQAELPPEFLRLIEVGRRAQLEAQPVRVNFFLQEVVSLISFKLEDETKEFGTLERNQIGLLALVSGEEHLRWVKSMGLKRSLPIRRIRTEGLTDEQLAFGDTLHLQTASLSELEEKRH